MSTVHHEFLVWKNKVNPKVRNKDLHLCYLKYLGGYQNKLVYITKSNISLNHALDKYAYQKMIRLTTVEEYRKQTKVRKSIRAKLTKSNYLLNGKPQTANRKPWWRIR